MADGPDCDSCNCRNCGWGEGAYLIGPDSVDSPYHPMPEYHQSKYEKAACIIATALSVPTTIGLSIYLISRGCGNTASILTGLSAGCAVSLSTLVTEAYVDGILGILKNKRKSNR